MLHSCDVTILGAGVIGCAIARALSRFDCSFAVPERAEMSAAGSSRQTSAIIRAQDLTPPPAV